MKRKLVFWAALNSYQSSKWMRGRSPFSPHPVTTEAWTDKRIDLFKQYTLPSILNQSYENFLFVVLLDPELKYLTESRLPETDKRVIYCYQDAPILEMLRKYDEVIMALIDCDDMYSEDAGKLMMECPSEWMYFKIGYAYEPAKDRLFDYDTIGTGPFWARRRNPKEIKRFEREKRYPGHKSVINYDPQELGASHFCVVLHDLNTSSNVNMRNIKTLRPNGDWSTLKKEFGL